MIHVSVFVGCWRFVNMWRKLLRWSLRIVCLAWLAYLSGCVAYIEIQPAETLPNRRPYIRVIDPDIDMITLDSNSRTKIEFKLQVGDEDLRDDLFVYWLLDPHLGGENPIICRTSALTLPQEKLSLPDELLPELREQVLTCELEYSQFNPGSIHILRFVVGDRAPTPGVSEFDTATKGISWASPDTVEVAERRFTIQIEQ